MKIKKLIIATALAATTATALASSSLPAVPQSNSVGVQSYHLTDVSSISRKFVDMNLVWEGSHEQLSIPSIDSMNTGDAGDHGFDMRGSNSHHAFGQFSTSPKHGGPVMINITSGTTIIQVCGIGMDSCWAGEINSLELSNDDLKVYHNNKLLNTFTYVSGHSGVVHFL